ncbi:hypothetical protein M2266_006502 [Streptomyces sp. SPB162]|nr:hypothetical protein [Streptomyces sp. SPB162]
MIRNSNRRGERSGPSGTGSEPETECGQCQGDDYRYEDRGDLVGQALGSGLAVLGVFDQAGHPGQLGISANSGGSHHQASADVDRRPGDRVADRDFDRDGLTGQHALIHRRTALLHDPVRGDLLARPDDEDVADRQVGNRNPRLATVAQDADILGSDLQQSPQRGARAAFGARLEKASGQDERGDTGGGLQVDIAAAVTAGDGQFEGVRHTGGSGSSEEQGPEGPDESSQCADRDERVHGGGAMPQIGPSGLVEGRGRVADDGCGECEGQPLPVGELPGRHHGQGDHRDGECDRGDQSLAQRRQDVHGGPVLFVADIGGDGYRGGVPGLFHHTDQVRHSHLSGGVKGDLGLLRRVVDGGRDAVHPIELLLDTGRARGARHAADRQLDLVRKQPCVLPSACAHQITPRNVTRSRPVGSAPYAG